MEKIISCCGIVCSDCKAYPDTCSGCPKVAGAPYWVDEVALDICPLYACCALEKAIGDCGPCWNLPCDKYVTLKDPSLSDEEHAQNLKDQIADIHSN